ncbi:MAG: MFS transporter [Candidatus Bipolaricaulota bacterium]|nr:MAG: MFS transporter [Candidatus Bipolaricaulota bacterium]
MISPNRRAPWRRTALLFIGHLLNDGYAAFFAPLLPLLIDRLGLSLALAGALGTAMILTNSLLQPGLGHLVDRAQRPFLVVVGPLMTVTAMSLIGRVASFELLLVVMFVAGAGTALFHPAAAALVGAQDHPRRGLLMAFFSSGGTIGGALAPLVIVAYVQAASLAATPWLLLPGATLVAAFALPLRSHLPPVRTTGARAPGIRLPRSLVLLWIVIVLRSVAGTSFASFLAVLVTERGGSPLMGGAAISVFLLCGAAGGFAAGALSDRIGRKTVILGSLLLATPCLLGMLWVSAIGLLPVVAVAGVFTLSSTPVGVVTAQESLPGRTALVSGLFMGTAWGVGGLALTPVGWLADRFGLPPVLSVVAVLPLVAALLMIFFRHAPVISPPPR